ncbi:MAG TPA: hypothetical protein VGG61_16935 [Gemmataceae bacterium]|jgi:hypothetical protein
MSVQFACPACGRPGRVETTERREWQCPFCDHFLRTAHAASADASLHVCAICGNTELYKKKGFPHWLGLTILGAACLAFLVLNLLYLQWWAWAALIGSAVFDGLLYLWVPDVVACYRCDAHHSGLESTTDFQPFELVIAERYRQERIRREQRKAGAQTPS